MNHYGYLAQQHWARWLPQQYAAIEDPDSFFSDLGNRAESRIDELADHFAGEALPGEGYLERVGRLGQARRQAEEIVLHQMILLEPGAGSGRGRPGASAGLTSFRPAGQEDLAPSGAVSRVGANLAALAVLRTLQHRARPAAPAEQAVLARWSGWGAVPEVFDGARQEFAWAREQLAAPLPPADMAAARRTTLNAHYTGAALVQAIWDGARKLGFTGGRVLEPGCGPGNFIGFAPGAARVTGVELDPVTAGIAAALYPNAQIRNESFADTRDPDGSYDLAIGNVPFGKAVLRDQRHNPGGHVIANIR